MYDVKKLLEKVILNHDENAILMIIEKFKPIIKKIATQLNYDDAESDVIIFFLEFIYKLDIEKIAPYSEEQIVSFIVKSLRNKKIDIYRKRALSIDEIPLEKYVEKADISNSYEEICLFDLLKELTERQRKVIISKYYYGYTDIEIARKLNITRQAVNKLKRKGEENLRKRIV